MLSSNRKAIPLTEEKPTHDDHSDSELDDGPCGPAELDSLADVDSSESILAGAAAPVSFSPRNRETTKTGLAAASADSPENVSSGWLNEWFGPTSPRRNAWLFTTVTGVLGMILALLLLFSGHRPSQNPEQIKLASGAGQPDPFAESDPAPISGANEQPEPEPSEPPEPKPDPIVVTQPKLEPVREPAPELVVEAPENPKPVEPEPEPEDQFELRVILLPDPENVDQGEQFEVTGTDRPAELDEGFDPAARDLWQESLLVLDEGKGEGGSWKDLEQLVPLGPLEPQAVANEVNPTRKLSAEFLTTQPRRGTRSLLMPYEMAVTNRGSSAIDRLRLTQTLPEGLRLRSTSSVHDYSEVEQQLSWEFEGLSPLETWRVPMVVIPATDGTLALQTTLEGTVRVSSRTEVLAPEIKLEILADPHAPLNKYHRLLFRMTNAGDVPLKNLRMGVRLSENLWHRFGNTFVFSETGLEVGEVREALLHVKTLKEGEGTLNAKLVTEEGVETVGSISFAVGEQRTTPDAPAEEAPGPPAATDRRAPTPAVSTPPRGIPTREIPTGTQPVPPAETPLIRAEPRRDSSPAPRLEPRVGEPEPPARTPPAEDDFPAFPGELDPLPDKPSEPSGEPPAKSPVPPARERIERKDPFEIPPKEEPELELFKSDG